MVSASKIRIIIQSNNVLLSIFILQIALYWRQTLEMAGRKDLSEEYQAKQDTYLIRTYDI